MRASFDNSQLEIQNMKSLRLLFTLAFVVLAAVLQQAAVRADIFGTGSNTFNIDFVDVGNAGNGDDLGAGGGYYSSPYGGVAYAFRMGVTETAQDWIIKATNLGLTDVAANAWVGNQPAANITWYEAAAFVNWLNTSTGHHAAYNLNGSATALTLWNIAEAWDNDPNAGVELNLYRHKDTYYFLPSEDEWYKAAYHQNDGVTENYWDYATGSNNLPTPVTSGIGAGTAVWSGGSVKAPATVDNSGGLSSYGTRGQNGNVFEWMESALDGVNDSPDEYRAIRGGFWGGSRDGEFLRSSSRYFNPVQTEGLGFRVASIPEPSSTVLMLSTAMITCFKRRRSN